MTSSPVQTASAKQTLLVFAGMVFSIWLAWTIRARVLETPQLPTDGPLKPFVIAQTAAPACVAPGCNLVLDYPRPGQVVRVQAAQLQLPEVRLISAEPGYAFVPQSPPLLYVVPMDSPRLPFVEMRLPLDDAAPNPRAPGVDTDQPGWVRAGRDLASGAMIDFAGAGSLPATAPRAYSEFRFQPVPTVDWWSLTLSEQWPTTPVQGNKVMLHFSPATLSGEVSRDSPDLPLEAYVHSFYRAPGVPDRTVLSMDMGESYRMRERRFGNPVVTDPLPQALWLEWQDQTAGAGAALWRVPVTALVKDGTGLRLWLAVAGWAVPITVTELQRVGAHSVVIEQAGARGMPIRAEDWRALGSAARRATYLAHHDAERHLLHVGAQLIVQPPTALPPGSPVGSP